MGTNAMMLGNQIDKHRDCCLHCGFRCIYRWDICILSGREQIAIPQVLIGWCNDGFIASYLHLFSSRFRRFAGCDRCWKWCSKNKERDFL